MVTLPGVAQTQIGLTPVAPRADTGAVARALVGLGGAITQGAGDVEKTLLIAQEEERLRRINDAKNQAEEIVAADLNNGFYQRRGSAAADGHGQATADFAQKLNSISDQYKDDPELQRRVQEAVDARRRRELPKMATHAATQHRNQIAANAETTLDRATERAIANRSNPDERKLAVDEGLAAIAEVAAVNDWSDEVTDAKELAFTSGLHREIIRAYGSQYDIEGAREHFNDTKDDIDRRLHDDIRDEISTYERARSAEASRRRAVATAGRKEEIEKTGNKFFGKAVKNDLEADEVMASDLPAFGVGGKQDFLRIIEIGASGTAKTNSARFNELFFRINLPEGDPNRITDANALNKFLGPLTSTTGGLDMTGLNILRKEVDGTNTPEGRQRRELRKTMFDAADKQIRGGRNPLTGLPDKIGEQRFQAFKVQALAEEDRQRKLGVLDADSYNPDSKKYIGSTIDQYTRTLTEIIQGWTPAGEEAAKAVETLRNIAAKATRTAKVPNPDKEGDLIAIYEVDGVWVFGDGSEVK